MIWIDDRVIPEKTDTRAVLRQSFNCEKQQARVVMKICYKCNKQKPLSEFYKHSAMQDGYLGKCKDCARTDVKNNRIKREEYYQEYDKLRYKNNPNRREQCLNSHKRMRSLYPDRYKARTALNNAVRDKRIERPVVCSKCKQRGGIEAHHEDYSKPLDVVWLCSTCHAKTRKD